MGLLLLCAGLSLSDGGPLQALLHIGGLDTVSTTEPSEGARLYPQCSASILVASVYPGHTLDLFASYSFVHLSLLLEGPSAYRAAACQVMSVRRKWTYASMKKSTTNTASSRMSTLRAASRPARASDR